MVSSRFTTFITSVLILLLRVSKSSSDSHQGVKKIMVSKGIVGMVDLARCNLGKANKEGIDGKSESTIVSRGRKMMIHKAIEALSKKDVHGVKKKTLNEEKSTKNISQDSTRDYHKFVKKANLNAKARLSTKTTTRRSSHMKQKIIGTAAFSADYHGPIAHPPINN